MQKKNLVIAKELDVVFSAMKRQRNILAITETNGISTIEVDSLVLFSDLGVDFILRNDMFVEIDDVNYQVSNIVDEVNIKSFDIKAINVNANVYNIALNYKFGSRKEINQALTQEQGRLDRFPLVWLILPIDKDFSHQVLDFESEIILVFAHNSNKTDRAAVRIEENFKPVLEPLRELFFFVIQSVEFNYMFEFFGHEKQIDYNSENYYFYGNSDKTKSVLTTTTDAIETKIQLKFKKQFIN
jgi:hypothetical protein